MSCVNRIVRFTHNLLCKHNTLCFLKDALFWCFFYPINLIVANPFNENKLQLLETFENWGWEFPKQLFIFLAVFEPETVANV